MGYPRYYVVQLLLAPFVFHIKRTLNIRMLVELYSKGNNILVEKVNLNGTAVIYIFPLFQSVA